MKNLLTLTLVAIGGCGAFDRSSRPDPEPAAPTQEQETAAPITRIIAGTYAGWLDCEETFFRNNGTTFVETRRERHNRRFSGTGIPMYEGAEYFVGREILVLAPHDAILVCVVEILTPSENGLAITSRCREFVDGDADCDCRSDCDCSGAYNSPSGCDEGQYVRARGTESTAYLFRDDGTILATRESNLENQRPCDRPVTSRSRECTGVLSR